MMKILKKINLLTILTIILGLGLMNGSLAQRFAVAGKLDTVPAIQVNGLYNHIGQYLHVLYAVGQLGFIDLSRTPELLVIRYEKNHSIQITDSTLIVPSVVIEKTPGRGSYNMVVFAVSDSAEKIKWEDYSENPNPTAYKYMGLVFKSDIDKFMNLNNENLIYQINF